ncbi:MAG: hypothetical protein E7434_07235 [Ruminococcaceae bacterium]|nr:hypothetical protein [Oscillospiraceae bacterium]
MRINAVCEYNNGGYLIYAADLPGAYVRGETQNQALAKFDGEVRSYLRWCGIKLPANEEIEVGITQRKLSELQICDADSDVLFDTERAPLTPEEYQKLKLLALRSARDFNKIFQAIENPSISDRPERTSFYGLVPRTPLQMYEHTNRTTAYYAAAFGIEMENAADIYANRMLLFSEIEVLEDFLSDRGYTAPDGEAWTLRKLLRRLIWHDRIHAKAMWRTAVSLWGSAIPNPFYFR